MTKSGVFRDANEKVMLRNKSQRNIGNHKANANGSVSRPLNRIGDRVFSINPTELVTGHTQPF